MRLRPATRLRAGDEPSTAAVTQFVNQYREQFGVEPICEVLEFPTSTYYAARKRAEQPSARAADDEKMVVEIRRVWKASGKRYGARKVYAQLRREGIAVARCTVERLMRRLGMSGLVVRRRRPRTTIPSQAGGRPRDLVDRDFRAPAPNQLWVTDLTYVALADGRFVYTAFGHRRLLSRHRRLAGRRLAAHRPGARRPGNGAVGPPRHPVRRVSASR